MSRLSSLLRIKRSELLARTKLGRRANLPQYRYAFSPSQLWTLATAIEASVPLDGVRVEVGVFTGETTVYLHKHLAELGAPQRPYYALDTFEGFTSEDIAVEHESGRTHAFESWFAATSNSIGLFEAGMRLHGLDGTVTAIQADASTFDYGTLPPIAFALVDVDLERPVQAALEGIWPRLVPGGIVVVDDCKPNTIWEGALVAYERFCAAHDQPVDIRADKLGHLTKPAG